MVGDMLVPSRVFVCWVKTPCWFFGGILKIFTSFYFTKDQTFRLGIKVRKQNWHNVRICWRWVLDLIAGHILVGLIHNIKYIFISGATYVQVAVIPKDFSKETTLIWIIKEATSLSKTSGSFQIPAFFFSAGRNFTGKTRRKPTPLWQVGQCLDGIWRSKRIECLTTNEGANLMSIQDGKSTKNHCEENNMCSRKGTDLYG